MQLGEFISALQGFGFYVQNFASMSRIVTQLILAFYDCVEALQMFGNVVGH